MDLAPIASVDHAARCFEPALSERRSVGNETDMALGDRERDSGLDRSTLARLQAEILEIVKIETRIIRMSASGESGIGIHA